MSETRLKIAVFIDFDNIEIGIKKTLSRHFDVGAVLEAIKERGEVVTKIAYGDWKHAPDYSRALTQHAVHMVQRNLTPGGDKNGADITLALDALEMAFTRSHINAFVIVGGDSDFIALVEKLKQYDKMVFVVGGRSFTSTILQKNCHEFIAYENLIGLQPTARKATGRVPAASSAQLRDALPHLRRALAVLSDREVSPQLGLLKSTLLQLDSTFSERDYGARSFREFIQKMANAGFVNLKQVDRSLLVEIKDGETPAAAVAAEPVPQEVEPEPPAPTARESAANGPQSAEAVAAVRRILDQMGPRPHWPMYLRSFKHFLRSSDPSFDEHRFGIHGIHDLARAAQREGLLRVERNRQGILRIYPGDQYPVPFLEGTREPPPPEAVIAPETPVSEIPESDRPAREAAGAMTAESMPEPAPEIPAEEQVQEMQPAPAAEGKPRRRKPAATQASARRKKPAAKRPRASKKANEAS